MSYEMKFDGSLVKRDQTGRLSFISTRQKKPPKTTGNLENMYIFSKAVNKQVLWSQDRRVEVGLGSIIENSGRRNRTKKWTDG